MWGSTVSTPIIVWAEPQKVMHFKQFEFPDIMSVHLLIQNFNEFNTAITFSFKLLFAVKSCCFFFFFIYEKKSNATVLAQIYV